ncbi:MAG TPA: outer membrane lipoprotein carrier protein LolA [Candidatus Acidoferrum sp.]|nr:outer membrane lipoprotein carrier protein LolA [Candidatus Acidoferrum sp.]
MLFLFTCFLSLAASSPASLDTHQLVKLLESRYHSPQTLQATFLERYSENGRVVRSEAGTASFRRPGKMRWDYESPEKNLFLVDGKTAWFYVPADHTVTRAPAKQSSDWRTPLALLAGEMKLSRVCAHVEPTSAEPPDTPGDIVLYCPLRGEKSSSSKSDSNSSSSSALDSDTPEQSVYLEVAPETGELARVLVRDKGGVSIEFKFENWRFNPALPPSFFRFEVPRGVAIVNGEQPPNFSQ